MRLALAPRLVRDREVEAEDVLEVRLVVVEEHAHGARDVGLELLEVAERHLLALQLPVDGQREGHVKDDRVVDGEAEERANELKLDGRLERVGTAGKEEGGRGGRTSLSERRNSSVQPALT